MRIKFVYVATVALLASGMVLAQSSGQNSQGTMDSPSGSSTAAAPQTGTDAQAKEGETQSGKPSQANPEEGRPGAMGTPTTPNQAESPKGETPATGEQKGTANDSSRPGVDPAAAPPTSDGTEKGAAPQSSDSNAADTPSYAKPITSKDGTDSNSTSTPSQKSADGETSTPK
jgi:hypothetical protein